MTSAVPLIDSTSVTLGGTLSNETINDLPLNGRNFINLLSLRPGVEQYPGGGAWTQASNGLRVEDQNWIVDGLDNNESNQGQPVLNSPGTAGDSATILPIDAIQEFNVEENPKAEWGWRPGAVVNVGLKSGTNSVHGSAYAFGREDAWDAKNYYTPTGSPNPPLNFEQWGGTVGGPIARTSSSSLPASRNNGMRLEMRVHDNDPDTGSRGRSCGQSPGCRPPIWRRTASH